MFKIVRSSPTWWRARINTLLRRSAQCQSTFSVRYASLKQRQYVHAIQKQGRLKAELTSSVNTNGGMVPRTSPQPIPCTADHLCTHQTDRQRGSLALVPLIGQFTVISPPENRPQQREHRVRRRISDEHRRDVPVACQCREEAATVGKYREYIGLALLGFLRCG